MFLHPLHGTRAFKKTTFKIFYNIIRENPRVSNSFFFPLQLLYHSCDYMDRRYNNTFLTNIKIWFFTRFSTFREHVEPRGMRNGMERETRV